MSIFTDCNQLCPLNQTYSSSCTQSKVPGVKWGGNACSPTSVIPSGSTLLGPSPTRSHLKKSPVPLTSPKSELLKT